MAIADSKIQLSALTPEVKKIVSAVNAGTATADTINASNIDLAQKAVLLKVLATTATRESINGSPCDLTFKSICLGIAGV